MRVVVVGTGRVAVDNYLPVLAAQPDVALALVNRTSASAASAADTFDAELLDDLGAVAAWKPDVAFVLTAEPAHLATGTALIGAGVPRIFFEKPLVAADGQMFVSEQDAEDARSMIATAEAAGIRTAMMFNYRHLPHVRLARSVAAERDFGAVQHIEVTTHFACWSHCIDLICELAGPIGTVVALAGEPRSEGGAVDLTVSMGEAAGAAITLLGTEELAWQHPLFEFAVGYERGRVLFRDLDGRVEVFDGAADTGEVLHDPAQDGGRWEHYRRSFESAILEYLDSVRVDGAAPVPATAGLRELDVEAAIRRSVRLGHAVTLGNTTATRRA